MTRDEHIMNRYIIIETGPFADGKQTSSFQIAERVDLAPSQSYYTVAIGFENHPVTLERAVKKLAELEGAVK